MWCTCYDSFVQFILYFKEFPFEKEIKETKRSLYSLKNIMIILLNDNSKYT